MSKFLVAYFSASGRTAKAAKLLAEAAGADLYEIKPAIPYTRADLSWINKNSRSSLEMKDKACRPELADSDAGVEEYDAVFLGFPIWWFTAPRIIRTFLRLFRKDRYPVRHLRRQQSGRHRSGAAKQRFNHLHHQKRQNAERTPEKRRSGILGKKNAPLITVITVAP